MSSNLYSIETGLGGLPKVTVTAPDGGRVEVYLHGATVTGDALNCEPQSITLVVENGGDFLFQLKNNQPTALAHAMDVAMKLPPLLPANLTRCRSTGARNGGFTRSGR